MSGIYESPRVTWPYNPGQWEKIDALGETIEERLQKGDVRLTMGGEPTFVSIDDPDGDEWNIEAMGPNKRKLAFDLILRLRQRFAPDGLLTFGQGKLYPGEPLPRWAFGLFWRGDGLPLWTEQKLIACRGQDYKPSHMDAQKFMASLCDRLGVDDQYVLPAYEDPLKHIEAEQDAAGQSGPRSSGLREGPRPRAPARVLRKGLDTPSGYVLPLRPGRRRLVALDDRPVAVPWEHMFLLPWRLVRSASACPSSPAVSAAVTLPWYNPVDPYSMADGPPAPIRPNCPHLASALRRGRCGFSIR